MSSYHVFCESCDSEYDVSSQEENKPLSYCCMCGNPLDESTVVDNEPGDDEWGNLYKEVLDDLDDIDDWKVSE